ncbi:MAG: HAD domain-containing protein [Cytophagales bacterium]|jgi:hypothetical protein|nr:HAD domain-containing protein [Cytophagales bacterium]
MNSEWGRFGCFLPETVQLDSNQTKKTLTILLDIDGVLVTTPSWKPVELLSDGFLKFNERATENLKQLIEKTNASIVLTTTHRIKHSEEDWKEIFKLRGLEIESVSKINSKTQIDQLGNRAAEISEWIEKEGQNQNYVIIDDDLSINSLPMHIKERWAQTKPLIGFDEEAMMRALRILMPILP